jgi:hypothetical protein
MDLLVIFPHACTVVTKRWKLIDFAQFRCFACQLINVLLPLTPLSPNIVQPQRSRATSSGHLDLTSDLAAIGSESISARSGSKKTRLRLSCPLETNGRKY